MQKQICIPSDTGYSLKVYIFASAPFNMFSVVHNLYRLSVGLSIDENPIFIFHYKISDNRAIIKLETVKLLHPSSGQLFSQVTGLDICLLAYTYMKKRTPAL